MDISIDKLDELLSQLSGIRIKEAVSLRKRLTKEKQKLETQIKIQKPKSDPNKKRSSFMKNVWRYIKLLRDTYPELRDKFTSRQMFSQYFARRRGEDVDINDVFWQNPS